ncbi:HD-GYP domain-containing protein [Parahaliea mediterranea]|uniref:HD-GYP domain-containing protein n=1 Tax=Parahaliea mediterranea TaxID=651086 RepID=A0A939DGK9_9GAMM|nr:HD-GYP domain-containing protein [Parahaliea mediterranea]MBN7797839.1 HD-GYP domain-containing protein [Parahaliea mediterranea]
MLSTIKIYTTDLELGMFVSGLDRSWLDTPFAVQGFRLESHAQIEQLQDYCQYVLVDTLKSYQPEQALQSKLRNTRRRLPAERIFQGRDLRIYRDDSDFFQEQPLAEAALESLVDDLLDVYDKVSHGGNIDQIQLKRSVEPLIGSISRNPDACLWVARLKQHDEYSYHKALAVAIWSVSLGRELGLPRRDLRSLAMGGMLMDIGKLRVPTAVLRAERPLTGEEKKRVREHVVHGRQILAESGIHNQDVVDMIAYHHERFDGSGYPTGLKRDAIPAVARIAGIVDTYSALTSDRSYARAQSPSRAIRTLYEMRDVKFQAELVEAFIKAVGVYPAGSLVELSSGEVGVVVAESRTRRLRPKVMMLLDSEKRRLGEPRMVDLGLNPAGNDQQPPLVIRKSLQPGAYDIDLAAIELPAN